MRSNISGQITFTGLERHNSTTEMSTSHPEKKKIFCPQGYAMQKKIEELKGLDYCREHCGTSDRYETMMNVRDCFWIAKEGEKDEQTAT